MSVHKGGSFVLETNDQLKAIANETRARILRILEERSASAKQLSGLLQMSHGKVGHHVKVLAEAGLIEVVEERKVRAMTERLYGLTYERLAFDVPGTSRLSFTLDQAVREASPHQPFDPPAMLVTARMSEQRAAEFHLRIIELAEEFGDTGDDGAPSVYGLTAAVFATETPGP